MQNSSRRNIPFPQADRSDVPDIPQHFANLIAFLDIDTPYYSGTLAARPAFNAAGHRAGEWYYATDTGVLFFNTGAAWVQITAQAQTQTVLTLTGTHTYTTPTGCRLLVVEGVGGGGSGGGVPAVAAGFYSAGGGGGGAGWARKSILNPAATYSYTIGTGGAGIANGGNAGADSLFGAVLVARGGLAGAPGGPTASAGPNGGSTMGGGFAAANVGDVTAVGDAGDFGVLWPDTYVSSGKGGAAARGYGGGGRSYYAGAGPSNGINGQNYGGAGSGAINFPSGAAQPGGAGAQGILVVTEHY